jgi:hypothetical protein
MIEYLDGVAVALGVVIGALIALALVKRDLARIVTNISASISDIVKILSERESESISVAQKKKEVFQKMGPKTFYYLDESQVKDLYPQVFQELEPKRIETRESKETKKGISAKLRLIEPKYERDRAEETTKIYDVEQTPPMMYNRVEQYLLEKGGMTFGVEEFEFDKSSIDEFKSMCEQMQSKFEFNIPEDLQANFVSDKMREFTLQRVKVLSGSTGYVAIQTEFSIIDIPDDAYILSFVHPLNEYLPHEDKKVRIQVTCAKECMTSSGVSTFKKDKSVKITCLGKVVSWDNENKILEISPIAIY